MFTNLDMFSRFWRCALRALPKTLLCGILLLLTLAATLPVNAQGLQRSPRPGLPPSNTTLLPPLLGMEAAPLASAQQRPLEPGHTAIEGDILIGLDLGADEPTFRRQIQRIGQIVGQSQHLHIFRVFLNAGVSDTLVIAWLRQQAGITFAENNHLVQIASAASPNDASYNLQWNLPQVKADQAWPLWKPQGQVVLAIVDTGVDYTHPDLVNMMFTDTAGNVVGHDSTGSNSFSDGYGHGTHCAGIAAAQTNNGTSHTDSNNKKYGIAGAVGWNGSASVTDTSHIKIMPVRVLDNSGMGSDATVADGIEWAADHGAQVISMSLGEPEDPNNPGPPAALNSAVKYAWGKGVVIVAAAGNNNTTAHFYPAACSNVISVAATDSKDTLASFSNYGSWVNVAAPGVSVYSTLPTYNAAAGWGTYYGYLSGTSMATPHVAAEAALLLGQKLTLTNQQVHDTIIANVDAIQGTKTISNGTGGRVDFLSALNAVIPATSAVYQINSGGTAAGTFTADNYYSGGSTYSTKSSIDLSGVTNPAPQACYQTERYASSLTYTLPNLTAGASYKVRLHFAELYWNSAGARLFNVSINSTQVLSSFDIFATAGAKNKAVIEEFTTTADSNGNITVTLTATKNNAKLSALEITSLGGATSVPGAPTALTATPGNAQVTLAWTAPSSGATSYNVKRSDSLSGAFTTIATLQSATTYIDGGTNYDGSNRLSNGTAYYYIVTAMNSVGESANSNTASATPAKSTAVYQINSGGSAAGTFTADNYYSGGSTYSTSSSIDLSGVTNPAPQACYQTERHASSLTYTLPNLTAGASYKVRLHFAEIYWNNAGYRLFNVSINSTQVLSSFDIFATAGAKNKAVIEEFTTTADSGGNITVILKATRDGAKLSALEIISQ